MKITLKGYLEKPNAEMAVTLRGAMNEIIDTLYTERLILDKPGNPKKDCDKVTLKIELTRD